MTQQFNTANHSLNIVIIVEQTERGNFPNSDTGIHVLDKKSKKEGSPVTDEPMAEKDEVKKAEERTKKLQEKEFAGKPDKK